MYFFNVLMAPLSSCPPEYKIHEVSGSSAGPAVFCGVGLTLGLLGVATGTFLYVKGQQFNWIVTYMKSKKSSFAVVGKQCDRISGVPQLHIFCWGGKQLMSYNFTHFAIGQRKIGSFITNLMLYCHEAERECCCFKANFLKFYTHCHGTERNVHFLSTFPAILHILLWGWEKRLKFSS